MPLDRQFELFKGTEESQGVYNNISTCFVGSGFRQSSILRAQNAREEKLGTGIPAVLHEIIVSILFDAVRIRRDHKYGILHAEIQYISVCTHTYYDIPRISVYILRYIMPVSVYTGMRYCEMAGKPALRHING